jgi:hypothetical protein
LRSTSFEEREHCSLEGEERRRTKEDRGPLDKLGTGKVEEYSVRGEKTARKRKQRPGDRGQTTEENKAEDRR